MKAGKSEWYLIDSPRRFAYGIGLLTLFYGVVLSILRSHPGWFQREGAQQATSFGDAANWFQALIALVGLLVVAVAATQIREMQAQTKLQRQLTESAAYRVMLTPQMQSIKRFISSPEVQSYMQELRDRMQTAEITDVATNEKLLSAVRIRIALIGKKIDLPLLQRSASLDDIEALINEYNYLAKQLLEGLIDAAFATDLGRENFASVHSRVLPFVELRRRQSPKYASHFSLYVGPQRQDC